MIALSANTALSPIYDAAFLAREINDAHHQVGHHAQSMLLEAARAGDALIAAKKMVKHGEFRDWVEANCKCSYRSAVRYMQIARTKDATHGTFEGGINAFLEAQATPRKATSTPSAPTFDKAKAEYAIKLHRMATSANPNEAAVASTKLDAFAKTFGMAGEEVVTKAEALLGLNTESPSTMDAALERVMQPYRVMPKSKLVDILFHCIMTHPDLMASCQEKFQ